MFETLGLGTLPQLLLHYLVVLVTFIYMLRKYGNNKLYVLVILLFNIALFSFLSQAVLNAYKILTLIMTLWLSKKYNIWSSLKSRDNLIVVSFILFSSFFAYTSYVNNDGWTIIFSQYARYFIAFCLWFLVRKEMAKSTDAIETMKQFCYDIILMQIIISVGKLIIFQGHQIENLVGSISHAGGSAGTTIPILGFIVLWFYKQGKLTKLDWLYTLGLLLIGFLAGKRAVWFILPLVIAAFMLYVPKLKLNKTLIVALCMSPLAFYLGARLTPNMNPENKVWGSFDFQYAMDFADKYQNGDSNNKFDLRAKGRGGATNLVWSKLFDEVPLTETDWIGRGFTGLYATNYAEFDKLNSGINMKGSATGLFQTYFTNGYLGIFSLVAFVFLMLWQINMKRIRWVIIALCLWEYFFYIGNIVRFPAFMFLIIYFIHFSNFITLQHKKRPRPSMMFQPTNEK